MGHDFGIYCSRAATLPSPRRLLLALPPGILLLLPPFPLPLSFSPRSLIALVPTRDTHRRILIPSYFITRPLPAIGGVIVLSWREPIEARDCRNDSRKLSPGRALRIRTLIKSVAGARDSLARRASRSISRRSNRRDVRAFGTRNASRYLVSLRFGKCVALIHKDRRDISRASPSILNLYRRKTSRRAEETIATISARKNCVTRDATLK